MQPLYTRRDAAFVPGPATGSPWSPDTQHGGPAAALLAHVAESVADPSLRPCRLTVDLSRPLPKRPITVEVRPVRSGRRIAVLDVALCCTLSDAPSDAPSGTLSGTRAREERAYSQARALFLLPNGDDSFESLSDALPPPEQAQPGQLVDPSRFAPPGFHTAVEVRWVRSSGIEQAAWFRLPMAVVDGEATTPLMRAAAVSDFGNALARRAVRGAGPAASDFVNADLTLHLARFPEGEWIGLRLDRVAENRGLSYAQSTLFDPLGAVGVCTQTRLGV